MKTHTIVCKDCKKSREVRVDKNPPRCRSCAQKKAQKGKLLGNVSGRVCKCGKNIRKTNSIGYCYKCFLSNVDGIRTLDSQRRNSTKEGRINKFSRRGGRITAEDLYLYDATTNCEICERKLTKENKCLDHCHSTGRFRGALCKRCNGALGNLGDDLDLIINRLTKYKFKHLQ